MCGIFFYITKDEINNSLIHNCLTLLSHRGQDEFIYELITVDQWNILLIHTKFKISGDDTLQPLTNYKKDIYLIIDGEIFNYKEIIEKDKLGEYQKSNHNIILKLYERNRNNNDFGNIFEKLNGQYSFVLLDLDRRRIFVGRDNIGITPLYYGYTGDGSSMVFASELKLLTQEIEKGKSLIKDVKIFFPRNYMTISIESTLKYKIYEWKDYYSFREKQITEKQVLKDLKTKLEDSVLIRLKDLIQNNIEFGVLLNGLDSLFICSIINKYIKDNNINKKIKTFSIDSDLNSDKLKYKRDIANYLETDHHEYIFSLSEGIGSLEKVIWHTETFDTTLIRTSIPIYLLTKNIKKNYPTLKVLFSGQGYNELFFRYKYGLFAPSKEKFYEENKNLISNIHRFDCLTINKSCIANGIDIRAPFLDINFVDYVMQIPVEHKITEKHILTKVFSIKIEEITKDTAEKYRADNNSTQKHTDEIPATKQHVTEQHVTEKCLIEKRGIEINITKKHTKQKEQEDIVPTDWNEYLEYWANNYNYKGETIDKMYFEKCRSNHLYTYLKPETNEQLLYRQIFCKLFVNNYCKNTAEYTVKFLNPIWKKN